MEKFTKNRQVFHPENFVHFALMQNWINRASESFLIDYYDNNGERVFEPDRKRGGEAMRITFNRRQRKFIIPKGRKDLIEKIRNHPQCLNSPNGNYRKDKDGKLIQVNATFCEINDDKDAVTSISSTKMMNMALNKAFEIAEDEALIEDMAIVLGISGIGNVAFDKILLYAEQNPKSFLDVANSPELKARALATKALDLEVLKRGSSGQFEYGNLTYGYNKNEVIDILLSETDKFAVLNSAFNSSTKVKDNFVEKLVDQEETPVYEKPKRGRPKTN